MNKIITVINYFFSALLWLLGILILLFNLFGLWAPWHLAGFGFLFYSPIPFITQLIALIVSCAVKENKRKYVVMNLVSLLVSVGFVLLTLTVSTTWFW